MYLPVSRRCRPLPILAGFVFAMLISATCAEEIDVVLKDGRVLHGGKGFTAGLTEQPRPLGEGVSQRILFVDDFMRRTFVSKRMWREDRFPKLGAPLRPFTIRQPVKRFGRQVASTGVILQVGPFDKHGRRIITMKSKGDPVDIVQGITKITPEWVKLEGISHVWESRMPTTSLSSKLLAKLISNGRSHDPIERQKKIARFYLHMKRYHDAQEVLEKLLKKHGKNAEIREQVEPALREARHLGAQQLVNELKRRRAVGQHGLVWDGLDRFPSKDVAGNALQEVRELLQEYQQKKTQGQQVIAAMKDLMGGLLNDQSRVSIEPIAQEIEKELNFNTLNRMTAFRMAMNDEDMSPPERLALAVSGWLLGSNAATANFPNALSAYTVRNLVRDYLVEPNEARREELLKKLASQEAAAPRTVALLLEHMKPPLASEPVKGKQGYYVLKAPSLDKRSVRYFVQAPPEYDPYRTYPAIVTLHAIGSAPERQIEWWAGELNKKGRRVGQAGRHGYLVIAPQWTSESQKKYGYSAREHAAVLDCLRDACRRFSIDTDRVYLSGHAAGGDAAWDLGLAHPDLWAGVIPIVAKAGRYCHHYWTNAKYVPFYFIGGELDGRWMVDNAQEFDRYLKRGYNATVVEYLGRGREHYYDEILHVFDWMARCKRNFYPREFSCDSMRPWDNYFWWVETEGMPERSIVEPADWPPRGKRPMITKGMLTPPNAPLTPAKGVRVRSGASRVTVWLSPKMVDFENRVKIVVDGKEVNRSDPYPKADLATMLEDARTRADRLHPFWAKVVVQSGRIVEQ